MFNNTLVYRGLRVYIYTHHLLHTILRLKVLKYVGHLLERDVCGIGCCLHYASAIVHRHLNIVASRDNQHRKLTTSCQHLWIVLHITNQEWLHHRVKQRDKLLGDILLLDTCTTLQLVDYNICR